MLPSSRCQLQTKKMGSLRLRIASRVTTTHREPSRSPRDYVPGRMPTTVSALQHLDVLCVDGNSLTGRLPELATRLSVLALQGNKLDGACKKPVCKFPGAICGLPELPAKF